MYVHKPKDTDKHEHFIKHLVYSLTVIIWGLCMIGAAGELDCFNTHIRFREPDKSKDKADPAGLSYPKAKRRLERRWSRRSTIVPQRRTYDREGMDADASQWIVGLWAWQHHGTVDAGLP
ncbi:hypothetical protein GW17_00040593 [Ensete ventricosum]|nr:hypothetical protein GW17_00040593 [Ensete ventricosum]